MPPTQIGAARGAWGSLPGRPDSGGPYNPDSQPMAKAPQPDSASGTDVSVLLRAWSGGDQTALERMTPIVYRELHRLAGRYMRRERPGHSLQTTALVNEAYMRLVGYTRMRWQVERTSSR